MTLRELLGDGPEVEVAALAYDNRAVGPGTLFFCVPGFTRDGHDFAPDAVARGAAALVVQRPLGLGVPELLVDDVRAAMARAAARFHGDPTAELDVVGITGTSGKTTTTHLVRHLLEAAGRPCGLLGGVTAVVGGEERAAVRTTPEAIDLQATFREMLDAGDRACAMEVSSHALELRRVDGIHFAAAAFTNLSQDHLDFHPDMEAYFAAKLRLFEEFDVGRAIVVIDDEWGRRLADAARGAGHRLARAAGRLDGAPRTAPGLGGNAFTVRSPAGEAEVELPLRGRFNAANALVAMAAGDALGLDARGDGGGAADRRPGARAACRPSTRGRASRCWSTTRTSRARWRRCWRSARELASGPRDRGVRRRRRPRPREAPADGRDRGAARRPRDRDLGQPALGAAGGDHRRDPRRRARRSVSRETRADRRAAIAQAIELAEPGDVVVIAGKGHEQGQEFAGGRKEPFDDVEVARAALRASVRGRRGARDADGSGSGYRRRDGRGMRHWTDQRIAGAAGAELLRGVDRAAEGPARVVIDSRAVEPGDLFFALPGRARRRRPVRGRRPARRRLGRARRARLGARGRRRRPRTAPCSRPSTPSPRSARSRAPGGATSPRT